MSPEPLRPYALADFIAMKPGTFVGGLMHIGDSWHLGPEWLFQAGDVYPKPRSVYFARPISEYHVRWRRNLREFSQTISKSRLYRPPFEQIERVWRRQDNTIKLGFDVTKPIGIYLGHVLRSNGITLINVLSGDGFDIWI
jgi:hypothetical protein